MGREMVWVEKEDFRGWGVFRMRVEVQAFSCAQGQNDRGNETELRATTRRRV